MALLTCFFVSSKYALAALFEKEFTNKLKFGHVSVYSLVDHL